MHSERENVAGNYTATEGDAEQITTRSTPVDDVTFHRFKKLFQGNTTAFGQYWYDPSNPEQKKVRTEQGEPTDSHWKRHLEGRGAGLGIVPIRDDATCYFGAIDIDDEDTNHAALAAVVASLRLPLVVCRSKSGGAHLYLFLSDPAPAKLIQQKLRECLDAMHVGKNEDGRPIEVFPKQDTLREGETGNWINLPYAGGDATSRYAVNDAGEQVLLADFLTFAESRRITPLELEALDPQPFHDGPPCLQTLHQLGFPEGSRNQGLYNVGVYLKLKHPDDWQARLAAYNDDKCDPPVKGADLAQLTKSLEKREYSYKCSDLPIVDHCQKGECRKRTFGIQVAKQASADITVSDEFTDVRIAERFAQVYGDRARYCKPLGGWFVYDGKRWALDTTEQVRELAKELAETIYQEKATAAATASGLERSAAAKRLQQALALMSRKRLDDVLAVARSSLAVSHETFDRDPLALNCVNGTLNLETGELRPHRRDDFITKLVPLAYDPDAQAPRWETFLQEITNADDELRAFLQRAVGSSLTGLVRDQKVLICHGGGENGKSVFFETIRGVAGDYARKSSFDAFLHRGGEGGTRNDIIRLMGARLVTASEAGEGRRWDEALLKELTGGDTFAGRKLYASEFVEFQPVFKLWFATNHEPEVRGVDHGIWRRLLVVPFRVTIAKDRRDPLLREKLGRELPGILAWAVRGSRAWLEHGLGSAKVIDEATQKYRDDQDVLREYIDDCIIVKAGASVEMSKLHEHYRYWCQNNGHVALSKRKFAKRLRERGWQDGSTGVSRTWVGYYVRPDAY